MQRDKLFEYVNEFLAIDRFRDYCPNGLQVEGASEIRRVALGVSVNQALVDQAVEWGADTIIAHHGLFWRGDPQILRGYRRNRLKTILAANLNVAGYHLPLDGHLEVGNNACIAAALGLEAVRPFGMAGGATIGCAGLLPSAIPPAELRARVVEVCESQQIVSFLNGPALVQRVGIVSGGGGKMIDEAIAEGLDFYITGEAEEPTMGIAAEAGIHFVAAGHYRTETFGIKALGEHIADRFALDVRFFEIPNPV